MLTAIARRPLPTPTRAHVALHLLLLLALVLAAFPLHAPVAGPARQPAPATPASPTHPGSDPRRLPADLAALPELEAQRTARSATFDLGGGHFTSLLSDTPLHFRDAQGRWQPIDPAFQPRDTSFVVEQSDLKSRVGQRRAWLAAAVGDAGLHWQADALGATTAAGNWSPLAAALPQEPQEIASSSADGRTLRYAGGWSDPRLSERIVSAPDSVEHLLVLDALPAAPAAPQWLELRATLKLLPGSTLWANGAEQRAAFQTAGALEMRDAKGHVALVLDPVRAFELASPRTAVAGEYRLTPGAKAGTWTVGVATPWSWWASPARRFPAAIDPTMHVLTTTGASAGMAWVDNADKTGFGGIVLGAYDVGDGGPGGATRTHGYFQFNQMPAMLSAPGANPLVSITAAQLELGAKIGHMPKYGNADIDWEQVVLQPAATLRYLGGCPGDAGCGSFSLGSGQPALSYANTPLGSEVAVKPHDVLTVGPRSGDNSATRFDRDVTTEIRSWYNKLYDPATAQPYGGPAFSLALDKPCNWFENFSSGDNWQRVPQCTSLAIAPGDIRLRVSYDAKPLAPGQHLLNAPGVPSYAEKVFDLNTPDNTTNHQYALAPNAAQPGWRAIAVRPNHALTPATPGRAALRLLDGSGAGQSVLASADAGAKDRTAFILLDDKSPSDIAAAPTLRAEVIASSENDFASDLNRNYAIDYATPNTWALQNGSWQTQTLSFSSGKLVALGQFALPPGNTTALRVLAPAALDLALIEPTGATKRADAVFGSSDRHVSYGFAPENAPLRTFTFKNKTAGTWALAFVNQHAPIPGNEGPKVPGGYQVQVGVLTCPDASIPSAKFDTCQPVLIPNLSQPLPATIKQANGLTIYSKGGFTPSESWCTQNEAQGAPVIWPTVGQQQSGRWIVVGQGMVCYDATSGTLLTSNDSGVGLTYDLQPGDASALHHGAVTTPFVYGDTAAYPAPADSTGRTALTAASGRFEPDATTRRGIRPFADSWKDVTTPGADYLSPADMQAHGQGTVNAPVLVDASAAPAALSWSVPWQWYPNPAEVAGYTFAAQATQSPALHDANSFASIAGAALRVLDTSNAASGLITTVDFYSAAGGPSIRQFRAPNARITHDAQLGGASLPLQAVVLPPGMARRPDSQKSCTTNGAAVSCLDLRLPPGGYDWNGGDGDKVVQPFKLPDIAIDQKPGSVMLQTAGQLDIYSSDHPNAKPADFDQSLSFKTWGASVSVKDQPCEPGGPVVTVVHGLAKIALPTMGDDGSSGKGGTGIEVEFTLCQTSLHQAKLTFAAPPSGLPVGATGLGVYLISGEVLIGPQSTRITIVLKFETTDGGATVGNGVGTVIIDTAGVFDLAAQAKLVKIVDADLHLQVAWKPLDILLDAKAGCCGGLIGGQLHLHAWKGRGWQDKYSWLPDDDAFHFTGMIKANLYIPKGYIGDIGIAELPPFDVSFSLKIAFGQFCTDAACKTYKWGMSAGLEVYGVTVGLYVDEDGAQFILGTDSHRLIDEAPVTTLASAAAPAMLDPHPTPHLPGDEQPYLLPTIKSPLDGWPREAASGACTPHGPTTLVCDFPISTSPGHALFAAGWQNGKLGVTLLKPDGTPISAANAAAEGVTTTISHTATLHQVTFGVKPANDKPVANGTWRVKLDNVGVGLLPGIKNNFQLIFFSDPPAPELRLHDLNALPKPAGATVPITWSAFRGGKPLGDETKIELVYTPVISKPVEADDFVGTPIVGGLEANDGAYFWDTTSLAAGEYAVGARIDDHAHGNGPVVAWAPGTIMINDTTPPDAPPIKGSFDGDDGLIVLWGRPPQKDLAGYQVEYSIPGWGPAAPDRQRVERVLPRGDGMSNLWKTDGARLGGIMGNKETTVCVRAYDASNNLSTCTPFVAVPARSPRPLDTAPIRLRVQAVNASPTGAPTPALKVDWGAAPTSAPPAGYALSFAPDGCRADGAATVAAEGKSPIDVDSATSYTLHGLTPGQRYRVTVTPYGVAHLPGPPISASALNAVDEGQWAAALGLSGADAAPSADPDKDGLTNQQEFEGGSFPLEADSDGNGFTDGEEFAQGGAACGSGAALRHLHPKLLLGGQSHLVFKAATNGGAPALQRLRVLGMGTGEFSWGVKASAPWITLDTSGGSGFGSLGIGVDTRGLAPGHYTGRVTITTGATQLAAGDVPEEASVAVSLDVLPTQQFQVLLPLVAR